MMRPGDIEDKALASVAKRDEPTQDAPAPGDAETVPTHFVLHHESRDGAITTRKLDPKTIARLKASRGPEANGG